jgi:membrane protein implicated in regulation of membrane protease activity
MSTIIRLLPGFIGAVAAFVALKLLFFMVFTTLAVQALVFLAVYLVVTVLAGRAMRTDRTTGR